MTPLELIAILRLVAQSAPDVMALIDRLRNGEEVEVTDAQLVASARLVRNSVQKWDDTESGSAT